MANNVILFNAALAGFIEGVQSGRNPTSQTQADYENIVDAAQAFATRMDSKIANDALISAGDGVALPPTTALIQQAQIGKTALLRGLCQALVNGRAYSSETAADYDDLCDVVAAQYAEGVAALLTA